MTEPEPIVRTRKPVKCPACGHRPVAEIHYGLYAEPGPELQQKIDAGLIVMGGCVMFETNPRWECSRCGEKIYQKERPR